MVKRIMYGCRVYICIGGGGLMTVLKVHLLSLFWATK